MEIKILYNGKYPNLCSGHLTVIINGETWDFGKYALCSTGWYDWETENLTKGEWKINFPSKFPDQYKDEITNRINAEIPWGCCGGCL